jgi:hypothetical protein
MTLQEAMVLIHNGEYERAIHTLEGEASDEARPPVERVEYCVWLAECYKRLDDHKTGGDWYLEAIKRVLSQEIEQKAKARQAMPLCDKAMECYKQGGDPADVLMSARLKQYLLSLAR